VTSTVYINGKFTAQRMTGVQRLASELLHALDHRLAGDAASIGQRFVLLCPPGGARPKLSRIEPVVTGAGFTSLHLWEQVALPAAARSGLLLNLTGSCPLFVAGQIVMFPDAAVFDFPSAYSPLYGRWYRLLFRVVSRTARLALTISSFSKSRLCRWLRIPAERILVLPCGSSHLGPVEADAGVLSAHALAPRSYLLAVGSANPTKNFAALVAAFQALPRDLELRLVIVGGANANVFAPGAEESRDPRILRVGPVPDSQLKALYQSALAFVYPSLDEGFGLPPLEAMSCGCAVAASNAASIPEVCGDAALYFDPTSTTEITAAMLRLAGDEPLCAELRARGLRRCERFSWDAAAEMLLEQLRTHEGVEQAA
jgi:glycosyltransferase involved in cell wall biosynthesis